MSIEEEKKSSIDAVVDRFQLRPVIGAVYQWLCSIWLAVDERSGELSPPGGREEKQYAHGCWLACQPMPVVKLMTCCKYEYSKLWKRKGYRPRPNAPPINYQAIQVRASRMSAHKQPQVIIKSQTFTRFHIISVSQAHSLKDTTNTPLSVNRIFPPPHCWTVGKEDIKINKW